MNPGIKNLLASIAGSVAGVITIYICEYINSMNVKMPEGLDMHNREALRAWMETLPASVYLVVLAGYVIGALDGSIVATIISGRSALRPAITVGVVLTLASLANVLMIPQPAWFVGASLCIPLPVAYLGYRIARKKPVVI